MTKSSKDLAVFDFKPEDEIAETTARKLSVRFKNLNRMASPVLKYKLLEVVARGGDDRAKIEEDAPLVDVDAMDSDRSCGSASAGMGAVPESNPVNEHCPEQVTGFSTTEMKSSSPGASFPGRNGLNYANVESPSDSEPDDSFADAEDSMDESSPPSPRNMAEDSVSSRDNHASDDRFSGWKVDWQDSMDNSVIVFPDYVIYQDEISTASLVNFTGSSIKLKCSIKGEGVIEYQWGIDSVTDIESQWYGGVETAMVKVQLLRGSALSTLDFVVMKFAVVDPNWLAKRERILSLNARYKALWKFELDVRNDDNMLGESSNAISMHYFPSFDDPFEDVVYPKGDTDAVSISKRDVDLLQPDTFVNDTIIDFYIKYLKNKIQAEEKHRFFFFNSFFFRKLADLDKDPSNASDGRAAFLRVCKWTRKVDLFDKDYIFIPVNFNLHWSLIIICHAGEVKNSQDKDIDKSLRVPCILHMDSIKGSHSGLKDIIRSYLLEEWKEKKNEISEDLISKFHNLRFVSLKLPQQENSSDCGLFLLHYTELFLEDAPVNFNPFKLTKFSNFLNEDWFPSSEASLKRALIERLIYELLDSHSRETSADCSNEKQFRYPQDNENGSCVEFIGEKISPKRTCHGNLTASQGGEGNEITSLETSLRSSECVTDSCLVQTRVFEPGASGGSLLDGQNQSLDPTSSDKVTCPSVMETVEAGQPFVHSPGKIGFQQQTGATPGACKHMNSCVDFEAVTFDAEISNDIGENGQEDVASSPKISNHTSEDLLKLQLDKINFCGEGHDAHDEKADKSICASAENTICPGQHFASASSGLETIVEDSQGSDTLLPDIVNGELCLSSPKSPNESFSEHSNDEESKDDECDDVQYIADNLTLTQGDERAAKRLRRTLPFTITRRLTRSQAKRLHT